jgi:predicted small integral membrane protein
MKLLKIALVAGMALVMTITTLNNILMPTATYGAIAAALSMATTFQNPMEIWRAITSPALLWIIAVLIILCEAIGAILCWMGVARLWGARRSAAQFNQSKSMASLGLIWVGTFYFIGWLVIANEWFGMWQSTKMNVLPDAFRLFAEALLITLWLNTAETDS